MRTYLWISDVLFLATVLSACASEQSAIDTAVAQTAQISQLETAAAAASQPTAQPPQPSSTETVAPMVTQGPPAETAPNPLPATNTGFVLNNGECFNFDNMQVSAPDGACDVWLSQPALFVQMNGAQISGYVTMEAPMRSHCLGAQYETGDLAVQTDLYMCFVTNEGRPGFIVVRDYLGGIPSAGIVFDYWLFD